MWPVAAACQLGGQRWVLVLLSLVRLGCGLEGGAHGQEALIWVPRPALWAQGTMPEEGSVGGAGLGGRQD